MRIRFKTASTALIVAFATPICGCVSPGAPAVEAASAPDDAPQFKSCSLEQVQSRKMLSRHPDISGVATPLLVHIAVPLGSERLVRNGEVISFSASNAVAGAQGVTPLQLEALDPAGRPAADATPLIDGTMIRLRAAAGNSSSNAPSDKNPPLVIVKADVPDQGRPSTCDAQIRDGDFVFIYTISPSVWLDAPPAGSTPLARADSTPRAALVNGSEDPSCAQDRETCVTDKRGGTVCAWAPACAKE
jgi:hypothetical protein